jgi:type IV secretion system protein VirB10
MAAGTSVVGSYRGGEVKTGQTRMLALSASALTREGIPVPLDYGLTDGLGRTGLTGDVDNHYPERFGAALLLTAADAAVSIAQSALSSANSQTLNIGGSISGGNGIASIAQEMLRSQINIPPTIPVPPGTIVSILVDHPVDFSDALKVTTTR